MQARIVTMTVGPGKRDAMTALADATYKVTKSLPGFVSATYFIFDEAKGVYGSITIWQSAADSEAAGQKLGPLLQEKAGAMMTAPPEIRQAEVYQPA
jgi:quinol monooxygenase YgiN